MQRPAFPNLFKQVAAEKRTVRETCANPARWPEAGRTGLKRLERREHPTRALLFTLAAARGAERRRSWLRASVRRAHRVERSVRAPPVGESGRGERHPRLPARCEHRTAGGRARPFPGSCQGTLGELRSSCCLAAWSLLSRTGRVPDAPIGGSCGADRRARWRVCAPGVAGQAGRLRTCLGLEAEIRCDSGPTAQRCRP